MVGRDLWSETPLSPRSGVLGGLEPSEEGHHVPNSAARSSVPVPPNPIVQVEESVRLARQLKQVGDLLSDRTLARPVDPGEQDAPAPYVFTRQDRPTTPDLQLNHRVR
jgi:hypothetical protein